MEKQTFVSKLSMVASLLFGSQNKTVGGHGEADSLHVYGAGSAQKGYLFKCQVYKRVSTTLRKSVFVVCKRPKRCPSLGYQVIQTGCWPDFTLESDFYYVA